MDRLSVSLPPPGSSAFRSPQAAGEDLACRLCACDHLVQLLVLANQGRELQSSFGLMVLDLRFRESNRLWDALSRYRWVQDSLLEDLARCVSCDPCLLVFDLVRHGELSATSAAEAVLSLRLDAA